MINIRHLKNILKISIILILLIVSIGSIYASDDSDFSLDDSPDDFELDEDLDDDLDDDSDEDLDDDLDDDSDEDLDDELDDELDDDSDEDLDYELDDDSDEDLDYELDDDSDEDLDDDLDDDWEDINDSDYFNSYEYLEIKIISYLDRYGNGIDENWTQSQEFYNEYQIYLANPSNYTLNESAEGYDTYLKIYNSIISTFDDYNLTENQTEYLKFLIIYFLNHYGNVSANYTWNDTDEFNNYYPWIFLDGAVKGFASSHSALLNKFYNNIINFNFDLSNTILLNNSNSTNSTSNNNDDINSIDIVPKEDSGFNNIVLLILIVVFVALVII